MSGDNKDARLPREVKEALQLLASEWDDVVASKALQVIPLKGAITNEVFQIKWPTRIGHVSRKVLVRIYGEGVEMFFGRDDEIRTFEFMSKNGQGPSLLGRFRNGRIEEFIHARTLSASDLRDPVISALIATKLREFHELDMPGPKKVWLWDSIKKSPETSTKMQYVICNMCLRDPFISALITAKLREFHELDMPGPKKVCPWDSIKKSPETSTKMQ